jgi:hypothetical protein
VTRERTYGVQGVCLVHVKASAAARETFCLFLAPRVVCLKEHLNPNFFVDPPCSILSSDSSDLCAGGQTTSLTPLFYLPNCASGSTSIKRTHALDHALDHALEYRSHCH